jgi:hypothetical protein
MDATIYSKEKTAFGSVIPLPLRGFPEGKLEMRIRLDDFVKVRVGTTDGIREFVVKEVDGFWEPWIETEKNEKL